jgi:chromosome segregation ATPase
MEDISTVRLDILALSGLLSEQQGKLAELDTESAALNGRITTLNSDLTADITRQEELLAALTSQVEGLKQENDTQTESLTSLGDGLAALQSDLNSSHTEIDTLGGDLDAVSGNVTLLTTDLGTVQEALAQKEAVVDKVSRSLSLFRIWEMVARARLQIADGNAGLAQADLEKAQSLLAAFLGGQPAENEEPADDAPALTLSTDLETALSIAYTRLGMAQENLDSSPETAVRDLDTAWEALDAALVILLEETAVANETTPPSE